MTNTAPEPPPGVVALIPMRNFVLFPHALTAISVGRDPSIAALRHALENKAPVGIVLQKDAQEDQPTFASLHTVGTLAMIVHHVEPEQGQHHAVCHGVQRFRLLELVDGHPFLAARIDPIAEDTDTSAHAEAVELQLRERAIEMRSLLPAVPSELVQALQTTGGPAALCDIVAGVIDLDVQEKQALLEMKATVPRVEKMLKLLSHRLEVVRLSHEIGERTKKQISEKQRIALASLFSGRKVRHDVAMTGEISLRGLVLPVGGVKEKVLAAQRVGLQTVLPPSRNLRHLAQLPERVRTPIRFVPLETVDDAIASAFDRGPFGDT